MIHSLSFGWFPKPDSYETDLIKISPRDDFEEAVSAVQSCGYIHKKWLYPPIETFSEEESGPPVPVPWFSLPVTHKIECNKALESPKFLEFIMLIFGWSQGLQLSAEGWGHHYRVATEVGMLNDFFIRKDDAESLLTLTEKFWLDHWESGVASKLLAAVHWYLYSYSYHQEFEKFMNQYQVLDACFRVYCEMQSGKEKEPPHSQRTSFLCEKLGLQMPSWAESFQKGNKWTSILSEIRNDLFHEARWAGAPIGAAVLSGDHQNILLELKAFNCRLIAALLGVTGSYISSSSQTRQMHLLKF